MSSLYRDNSGAIQVPKCPACGSVHVQAIPKLTSFGRIPVSGIECSNCGVKSFPTQNADGSHQWWMDSVVRQ